MAFENNVPSIVNPVVDGLRDISARRAATISNMIDEAAKHGLDDQFAYDAVWTYGADNGKIRPATWRASDLPPVRR